MWKTGEGPLSAGENQYDAREALKTALFAKVQLPVLIQRLREAEALERKNWVSAHDAEMQLGLTSAMLRSAEGRFEGAQIAVVRYQQERVDLGRRIAQLEQVREAAGDYVTDYHDAIGLDHLIAALTACNEG